MHEKGYSMAAVCGAHFRAQIESERSSERYPVRYDCLPVLLGMSHEHQLYAVGAATSLVTLNHLLTRPSPMKFARSYSTFCFVPIIPWKILSFLLPSSSFYRDAEQLPLLCLTYFIETESERERERA